MTSLPGLADKIRNFDRESVKAQLDSGEQERRLVLERFPRDQWAALPLERYALGLGGQDPTYCYTMEYRTPHLGSIKGGAAAKHIMYRKHDGTWHLPARLGNIEPAAAWEQLRGQFVQAFAAVEASSDESSNLDELDTLDLLSYGPALTTKSLATYFPDKFLPIYSYDHLSHFIRLFQADVPSGQAWVLNRRLRELISECELLDGWQPGEVMRLLYNQYDPAEFKNTTILKVAPGEGARWWHECLAGGYIAVGWDEVGDLTGYETDSALQTALAETWPVKPGGHVVKARQLLAYRDLKTGDLIIANQGKSKVLGVGTVTTGYRFDSSRAEGRHLVDVAWDTSYEQTLFAPEGSWQPTFATVKPQLWTTIRAKKGLPPVTQLPDDVTRVLAALERKKQVILYGVPGTGKTRLALRAALALADNTAQLDELGNLGHAFSRANGFATVRMVTFHPSYGYEDFVEGFKPRQGAKDSSGLVLDLTDGVFKKLCSDAANQPHRIFLLIIDELNRGDLPRIFGDLVTLLEADKRDVPIRLPISGHEFRVPPNVRIIATMNTADRSISHVDAAIRRRFASLGIAPDLDAIPGSIGPLNLADFLGELNARITKHMSADQQLGHSFLMLDGKPLAVEGDLHAVFYDEIVPLLEDYTFGRGELMALLLGGLFDTASGEASQVAVENLAGELAAEFRAAADAESVG